MISFFTKLFILINEIYYAEEVNYIRGSPVAWFRLVSWKVYQETVNMKVIFVAAFLMIILQVMAVDYDFADEEGQLCYSDSS